MAIYKLTRKTFSEFTKQAFAEKKAGTLQGSMADRVAQLKAQATARDAKAVADRAARKVAGTALQGQAGQISKAVGKEGYQKVINSTAEAVKSAGQQGFNKGAQSVGLKQGMINTWNNAGKMGKAGMVGAGIAGTALLAKGLLGGKKQQPQQVAN